MFDCLKNLDFISESPKLMIDKKSRYKNNLGGLFTIIYFITIITITIILSLKFLKRENKISNFNEEIINEPYYNIKNIPIFFQVYDQLGEMIKEPERVYKISAYKYSIEITYDNNGSTKKNITNTKLNYFNCSSLINDYDIYKDLILKNYYNDKLCLDMRSDNSLRGLIGDIGNFTIIYIDVEKCVNTTTNNNCFPLDYINTKLIKPVFTLRFLDFNINNNDLNNPVIPYIKGDTMYFSSQMIKIATYFFKNVDYNTDFGFIFTESSVISVSKFFERFIDFSILTPGTNLIVRINFSLSKIKSIYTRYFDKIQSLIAGISGISTIFLFFVQILNNFITDFYYYAYISNYLNIIEISEKNEYFDKKLNEGKSTLKDFLKINKISVNKISQKINDNEKIGNVKNIRVLENDKILPLFKLNKSHNDSNKILNVQENNQINEINEFNNHNLIKTNILKENKKPENFILRKSETIYKNQNKNKFFINFFDILFRRLFCDRNNTKMKSLDLGIDYIKKKMSVEVIINKLIDFDKLKFYLLNTEKLEIIKRLPGPKIKSQEIQLNLYKINNTSNANIMVNFHNESKDIEKLWQKYEF